DTVAGRYLVIAFVDDATTATVAAAAAGIAAAPDLFDDEVASFFCITSHPADVERVRNRPPRIRFLFDTERRVGQMFGAVDLTGTTVRNLWVIIDPTLRVIDAFAFDDAVADGGAGRVVACLRDLPPPARFAGPELQAPILYLPRVFEPELCRQLIDLYDAHGGEISGFMRAIDGKTVGIHDASHKVRRDVLLEDPALLATLQSRFLRRIVPEITKVHQYVVTRMERYLVACYDAAEGGHFAAHRDNTTPGTAHRRFAVSVNLNEDFEGGEVSFPEYGPRGFKAPAGGAVVFSCSLLHRVSRVSSGKRYAFLPFLYDDAAAQLREANRASLATGSVPPPTTPPVA
ncbi:MAG: 2OG-Fe(II) oxygenase, partial [Jannaschia sp.]